MSEQSDEKDVTTQWGVESPDGGVFTYRDPVVARIVSRKQRKPVLRRTVTVTPWEPDPDNEGYVLPPEACDNYRPPLTCLTAPSSDAGRCDRCRTRVTAP